MVSVINESQSCALSEAVHLVVIEPAVNWKDEDFFFWALHPDFIHEPGVLWSHEGCLFVQFDYCQLSNVDISPHKEFRRLKQEQKQAVSHKRSHFCEVVACEVQINRAALDD